MRLDGEFRGFDRLEATFPGSARALQKAWVQRVTTLYPDVFERNFPVEHYSVQKYRWQTFLNHLGINTGYYKNKFFTYYRQFGISPNYYAYILEK